MGKQPEAHRVRIQGDVEVVVLKPEVYEQLVASRPQVGARSAQVHTLRARLNAATELIDAIEAALSELPESQAHQVVLDLLANRPK